MNVRLPSKSTKRHWNAPNAHRTITFATPKTPRSQSETKAEEQEERISGLEIEVEDIKSSLSSGVQGPWPQVRRSKRFLDSDDLVNNSRHKRQRVQQREEVVNLTEPKFHTGEDWTRATFAKKNGIIYAYARVREEGRRMTALIMTTLESQISPVPLQIRRVLQSTTQEMADLSNVELSTVRSFDDKPYHVFLDSLAKGTRDLQEDVGVMVTQLVHLWDSYLLNIKPDPENVEALLNSMENTYTWHELNEFIGFDLNDVFHDKIDQLRPSLSQALEEASDVSGETEWYYLSRLIENISRFTLWTTLLGGCLVEGYGRGDFEDDDHGIKGFGLGDMATIIQRHYYFETTPSTNIAATHSANSRWFGARYKLAPLKTWALGGVAKKILDKLNARVEHLDVRIWNILGGWPLTSGERDRSGSESESDTSSDSNDEISDGEDLPSDTDEEGST